MHLFALENSSSNFEVFQARVGARTQKRLIDLDPFRHHTFDGHSISRVARTRNHWYQIAQIKFILLFIAGIAIRGYGRIWTINSVLQELVRFVIRFE